MRNLDRTGPAQTTNHRARDVAIFVATRREEVPAGCTRYVSVDGAVPGAAVSWDHHATGERINLDAMPERVDLRDVDGIGTTLADTDAVTSVVAALLGGKARLPAATRAVFECASHWCDHLGPHPAHGAEPNRLGRGLDAAVSARLAAAGAAGVSAVFATVARELAAMVEAGGELPYREDWVEHERRAAELVAQGRVRDGAEVAFVDVRGVEGADPRALYACVRAPVAVFLESHRDGGRRYTVGVNPFAEEAPADLGAALRALAAAEYAAGPPCLAVDPAPGSENWGGRATVFGSPWNYGSRLEPARVVAVVAEAVGGGAGARALPSPNAVRSSERAKRVSPSSGGG